MPPKIQMKIEEKNVCKFRSTGTCILNTFPIDENFFFKEGLGGGFWSRISENEKNPIHDSRKLKFVIFENFTNNGKSIRDINEGSRE